MGVNFLLLLLCLSSSVWAVNLRIRLNHTTVFSHLTRFDFSSDAGVLTISQKPATQQQAEILLLELNEFRALQHRFNPMVSYCDLHTLSTHSFPLTDRPFETLVRGGGHFAVLYVQKLPCNVIFNVWELHRNRKEDEQTGDMEIKVHLQNWDLGVFQECSSMQWVLFVLCMFIYSCLLVRFQLSTLRLMWKNTGLVLAAYLFALCLVQSIVFSIRLVTAIVYILSGSEAHSNPFPTVLGIANHLFESSYFLLLVLLGQGWMISFTNIKQCAQPALIVACFLVACVPYSSSTLKLCAFVLCYSELVRIMKLSRGFPNAKLRGKCYGPVALLWILWFLGNWPFSTSGVYLGVLVWTFRAEVIWELHGERPHVDVVKMLDDPHPVMNGEDEIEESEGLLKL